MDFNKHIDGHPPRVARPPAGQLLYRRYIPALGQSLSLRVASLEQDIDHFHRWMNDPRVSKFWGEDGPIEHQTKYLSGLLEDSHAMPVIGLFDDECFAYFEIYWSKEDRLGKYYEAENFDRGIHMLVGEQKFRGPHRVEAWIPSLAHYILLDDARTQRVVSEPRADNDKMIGYLQKYGFERHNDIQLPHKRAALMILPREHFAETKIGSKLFRSAESN
ncbi:siderophore biosynthesis protein [Basidiobolus meristosporus CBS 931.73]|uniref:Siderophore biosynthesis protein n=1 Tax=Basidiobolus meristosporus CBS 931.73 TaxID=1314790 RepID=A0A1Y1X7Q5_9FUNG|nr:siderophore biosynthesis protein [Basidiobolus meristosporus CBS 931.73]|eukprot:ORX81765.1 siderophore biosynthesis protein [Basidiobolus meristosporus CBS 931.73]